MIVGSFMFKNIFYDDVEYNLPIDNNEFYLTNKTTQSLGTKSNDLQD